MTFSKTLALPLAAAVALTTAPGLAATQAATCDVTPTADGSAARNRGMRTNDGGGGIGGWASRRVTGFYKTVIGPAIGARCALEPSCSQYFLEASRRHGLLGFPMTADRFVREPVVSAPDRPYVRGADGSWKHPDPVDDHDFWLPTPQLTLADDFADEGDALDAARQWRAAESQTPRERTGDRAAMLLCAADAYWRAREFGGMGRVLDKVEADSAMSTGLESEIALLRMLRAEGMREWASAADWAETLAETRQDEAEARRARRIAAGNWLRAGLPSEARMTLRGDEEALRTLATHEARKPASPRLGGALGLVPGLGYAWAGEWGNATRSLFLNALFGWAMYETARRDEWALFSVSTFFELTWYTGSIYGGIDAAERANRRAVEKTAAELLDGERIPGFSHAATRENDGGAAPEGGAAAVPLLAVGVEF